MGSINGFLPNYNVYQTQSYGTPTGNPYYGNSNNFFGNSNNDPFGVSTGLSSTLGSTPFSMDNGALDGYTAPTDLYGSSAYGSDPYANTDGRLISML